MLRAATRRGVVITCVSLISCCLVATCILLGFWASGPPAFEAGKISALAGAAGPSRIATRPLRHSIRLFPHHEQTSPEYDPLPFVTVVVVATSAVGWADRRERIRAQFPRNMQLLHTDAGQSAVLKFALGTQGLNHDQLKIARAEAAIFSDVLMFDCLDEDNELKQPHLWRQDAGPSSTTSKVLLSVQWAVRYFDFEYFFRLGDDSYFRIDKFLSMLLERTVPATNAVVGHIMTDRVFGMEQLYPQGMGYGLTYDVCLFIHRNKAVLLNTAPEDCVVARWLFAYGAQFVNSPHWRDIFMGDSCHEDMVLAHKLPPELWRNISDIGTVVC